MQNSDKTLKVITKVFFKVFLKKISVQHDLLKYSNLGNHNYMITIFYPVFNEGIKQIFGKRSNKQMLSKAEFFQFCTQNGPMKSLSWS